MAKHENDQLIRDILLRSYCAKAVKSLTDADVRFIADVITPALCFDSEAYFPIRNSHSKAVASVKGYMYVLVAFITEMNLNYPNWQHVADRWRCKKGYAQQDFDRARMIVLKLDSDIYSNFID